MWEDTAIHIEKTDQCYTCEFFLTATVCPLLEALALGMVSLNGDVHVTNCRFYREKAVHLKIVE